MSRQPVPGPAASRCRKPCAVGAVLTLPLSPWGAQGGGGGQGQIYVTMAPGRCLPGARTRGITQLAACYATVGPTPGPAARQLGVPITRQPAHPWP